MASWAHVIFGLSIVSAAVSASVKSSAAGAPTVKVAQGTLQGAVDTTADGTTFYKFLGIPYAKPPLGSLRFAAPQEPESWSGVRNATVYGPDCLQSPNIGSENCLFVNVYTPQLPSSRKNNPQLPVMVFIQGAAFVGGSANVAPGQLMNYDVVMVTIAYRLNLFGFVSIEGTDAPGNAGLKDQVAALQWIQKNIKIFGGNPKSITLFGINTGGASIQYHMISPLAKGLFHRAISESGSVLNSYSYTKNTQQSSFELSALVGRPAKNTSQLIANLRAATASELISALENVTAPQSYVRPFGPCIEFLRKGEKPFLLHSPTDLVLAGNFTGVPYITGTTKREGASSYSVEDLVSDSFWKNINENLESYMVPIELGLVVGSKESKEVSQKVQQFYFGNKTISKDTRETFVLLRSDMKYTYGVVATVHAHAKYSTRPTYNYWLTYGNATHRLEFFYVVYGGKVKKETSDDAALARSVGQLWTNFAKSGVPSASGEVTWDPVSTSSYPYLEINPPNKLKYNVRKEQMDFWQEIFQTYHNASMAR